MTLPGFQPEAERRLAGTAWCLLLLLWAVQVWRPQVSYPDEGVLEALVAIVLLVLGVCLRWRCRADTMANVAAVAGLAYGIYYGVRYFVAGIPAAGSDNFGTMVMCCSSAMAGYFLLSVVACRPVDTGSGGQQFRSCIRWFLWLVAAAAFLCSVHALCQYLWIYDEQYRRLLEEIGTSEPNPLQAGLLHHLRLKRVASVWGDPNSLGGFLAISLAASLSLALERPTQETASRWFHLGARFAALASAVLSALGIALTRSRGGVLDAVLVVCTVLFLRSRRVAGTSVALVLAAVTLLGVAASDVGTTVPRSFWRSNTVLERIGYARVGAHIIGMNPVFGSGPGAVDLYYGRFKTADLRESKYLHNWVLQVAAETGVAGLALCLAFVALLAVGFWRSSHRRDRAFQAVAVMGGVFLIDALFELSFNQRELMMLFGLCCAILLAGGASMRPGSGGVFLRLVRTVAPGGVLIVCLAVQVIPALRSDSLKGAAKDAFESGDLAQARLLLRRAEGWTPRDPQVYMLLAQIEAGTGARDSAFLLLEKAIRLNPESASLRARVAELALEGGRLEIAEESAREALELYPHKAEYHYLLARIQEQRGDMRGALESAKQAADLGYVYRQKYDDYLHRLEKKAQ